MLAHHPPLGWNSWDCFGTSVTEEEVLANATVMAERLLPHGWDTVVVDIAWYDPDAKAHGYNPEPRVELDAYGRQMPATNRFPSAAGGEGFGPLAARLHELGLKFGIHIMRGIPRRAVERQLPVWGTDATADQVANTADICAWNPDNYGLDHTHPAAQAWVDAQVAQFAAWGVDFIKADDMLAPHHADAIESLALAIQRSGRDITLSLSPGTSLSAARRDHLSQHAQMWRISDDLWDRWEDVADQFTRLARWAPLQRSGAWADADMIPIGHIALRGERGEPRMSRLTGPEQRTLMSLWCIARSPLMLGCDLSTTPAEVLGLFTNDAVLDLTRHTTDNAELWREDDLVVWGATDVRDGRRRVAIFNTGDVRLEASLLVGDLGAQDATGATDLWTGGQVPIADGRLALEVAPHDVALVALGSS